MKVKSSVKPICAKCKVVRRRGVVRGAGEARQTETLIALRVRDGLRPSHVHAKRYIQFTFPGEAWKSEPGGRLQFIPPDTSPVLRGFAAANLVVRPVAYTASEGLKVRRAPGS